MHKWKGWGAVLALALCVGPAVAATQPSEEQVRQLMEVVGVGKMLSQMNSQAVGVMQQSLPCVPASYWQNFIDANGTQQFIGRLVPIYQRHFSADEIEGMLKFYRSPLGQKVITEMPTTMGEANQAGLQWSRERSDQLIAELKQKGSLDANGRCPATNKAAPAIAGGAATAALATGAVAGGDDEDEAQEAAPVAKPVAKKAPTHTKAKAKTPAKTTTKSKKAPAKTPAKAPAAKPQADSKSKPAASAPAKPATSP